MHWMAESMHSFKIVNNRGFQSVMKTGQPEYYILSPSTVSHDIKKIFVKCQERIAHLLHICHCHGIDEMIQLNHIYQNNKEKLNFAIDAWNH